MTDSFAIPEEMVAIGATLAKAGHKAYLVGGCVRDLSTGTKPNDWDIATSALPKQVQEIFEDSVYENDFGTVLVKLAPQTTTPHNPPSQEGGAEGGPGDSASSPRSSAPLRTVEVTTFRTEGAYSDKRRPDEVKFVRTIEEDLARRDFTINAMAIALTRTYADKTRTDADASRPESASRLHGSALIDPFGGEADLKKKIIRAVGEAEDRFEEDALRLLRAVRFSAQLGFSIEQKTGEAIKKKAALLKHIAHERIRDEFRKLILSPRAAEGVFALEEYGLLEHIIPELREGIGCTQNKHHVYEVFEHNVRALEYTAKKNYSLEVRLASLLHDVGKPRTKRGKGGDATFHGHEVVGARMVKAILTRLTFPIEAIEKVTHLVRYHMFYYNVGEVSAAGVRRFLARVGVEHIDDIMRVREADRIGSKVPKAFPYKLRHLLFMIEKVRHDPLHPKMLAVRGDDVMRLLGIPAGPKVGQILFILLDEVLDDPARNTKEYLAPRVRELGALSDTDLAKKAKEGREKRDAAEEEIEKGMKDKYYVQ